jgi:hypothetical protein
LFCFAKNKPGRRRRRRRRRRTRQEEPLTWARALEQLGWKTLEALFYRRFRRCVSSTQHTHPHTSNPLLLADTHKLQQDY